MKKLALMVLTVFVLTGCFATGTGFAKGGQSKGKGGKNADQSEEHGKSGDKGKSADKGKSGDKGKSADKGKSDEKGKSADKGKSDEKGSKGKEAKARATEKKMARQEDKHRKRVARLEKMIELFEEKGNTQALANAKKALDRENQKHLKKMEKFGNESDEAKIRHQKKMEKVKGEDKSARSKREKNKGKHGKGDDNE